MTPLRVLIVEDEWPARNYLVELLQLTQRADVVAAVSSVSEAQQALNLNAEGRSTPCSSTCALDQRSTTRAASTGCVWPHGLPSAPMFVLATAHKAHALEAFELGVTDYLVKPFTARRVSDCVDRLLGRRRPSEGDAAAIPQRIAARRDRVVVFLDMHEVWACEAADRLTFVHSARGRFDLDLTSSSIAVSFGRTLLRVHRNWLVNPARVMELHRGSGETSLLVGTAEGSEKNGVRVPVAKERAVAIRDLLLASTRGIRHG